MLSRRFNNLENSKLFKKFSAFLRFLGRNCLWSGFIGSKNVIPFQQMEWRLMSLYSKLIYCFYLNLLHFFDSQKGQHWLKFYYGYHKIDLIKTLYYAFAFYCPIIGWLSSYKFSRGAVEDLAIFTRTWTRNWPFMLIFVITILLKDRFLLETNLYWRRFVKYCYWFLTKFALKITTITTAIHQAYPTILTFTLFRHLNV